MSKWEDLNFVVEFLNQILANGPIPIHEIHVESIKLSISKSDLNTARRSLQIKTVRKQGESYWGLPSKKAGEIE